MSGSMEEARGAAVPGPGNIRSAEIYMSGAFMRKKPQIPIGADELEAAAKAVMPREAFDYIAGAAGEENTKSENRLAFERCAQLQIGIASSPLNPEKFPRLLHLIRLRFQQSRSAQQIFRIAAVRHQIGKPAQEPQDFRSFSRRLGYCDRNSHEIPGGKNRAHLIETKCA